MMKDHAYDETDEKMGIMKHDAKPLQMIAGEGYNVETYEHHENR